MGRLLFTKYVLPFEVVGLLLLVAMIGAIVLTHESLTPRRRTERRLANPPVGLEQPVTGEFEQIGRSALTVVEGEFRWNLLTLE